METFSGPILFLYVLVYPLTMEGSNLLFSTYKQCVMNEAQERKQDKTDDNVGYCDHKHLTNIINIVVTTS